jgi:hypothetical protein
MTSQNSSSEAQHSPRAYFGGQKMIHSPSKGNFSSGSGKNEEKIQKNE